MKIKKSELIALIKEEIMKEAPFGRGMTMMDEKELERDDDYDDDDMMQEGMEGINPENMQLVADALQKMAPMIGVMSLPVLIGLIYEQLKNMGAK